MNKYEFVESEIKELLEKELWGEEDATLRGHVDNSALDMIEMTVLRAQLATVAKRMQALLETIEDPKVKMGEDIS